MIVMRRSNIKATRVRSGNLGWAGAGGGPAFKRRSHHRFAGAPSRVGEGRVRRREYTTGTCGDDGALPVFRTFKDLPGFPPFGTIRLRVFPWR